MRRHSERALPLRGSGMCQSFSSVPRTYIRTADELEPLSSGARLASFPTLASRGQSPISQLQPWPVADGHRMTTLRRPTPPPQLAMLPPKALPAGLPKSLRPSKFPPKNLDELDPLQQVTKEPGTGLLDKCVLCLLLNAVFVLALFLAFLIGHFASEAHLPRSNKTNNHSTSSSGAVGPTPLTRLRAHATTTNSTTTSSSNGTNNHDGGTLFIAGGTSADQREQEFRKSLERSRQRVPSLNEVYPPHLDSEPDPMDDGEVFVLPPLNAASTTAAHLFGNGPVMHRLASISSPNVPLIPLPKTVLPRHYNVELDLTEFYGVAEPSQVRCNLSILLEAFGNATAADDELVFHAGANIFIQRVQLHRQTAQGVSRRDAVPIWSVKRHTEREIIRLLLGERLKAGWYWLEMEFRSRICQSEFEGAHCFPSPTVHHHHHHHEQQQHQAGASSSSRPMPTTTAAFGGFSTKFEPNFARTFLPGWDEPCFRSTFNVTIRHFTDAKVLTNTAPIVSTSPTSSSNVCSTRFATTPPMPLYLLAFATGPFSAVEVRTARGNIPLTVWAAPQDMLAAHFVANFSPTMFERLQEDFGVKYPLSKMDIFLAPKLPVGGMENWGLIVLHTDAVRFSTNDGPLPLSVDASSSSSSSKEDKVREEKQQSLQLVDRRSEQYRAEKAITHELVHQWFGNLVGIWEWEELWIAEGFATYFVFDFLNAANHPHLTEHEYFLRLIELIHRQSSDGRSALVRPLRSAGQLYRVFDGIHLYTKGAVMVKMLKDLVGPAEFRAGITRFLRENSYQSVDRRAIWAAFPTLVDHGVDPLRLMDAMEPWLLNRGFPEVEVLRSYEDQSVRLQQRAADQNRHIVFLDDEAMQQMRMSMDADGRRMKRVRMAGRKRTEAEVDGEKGAESAEKDIEGILGGWMSTTDELLDGNALPGSKNGTDGTTPTTRTTTDYSATQPPSPSAGLNKDESATMPNVGMKAFGRRPAGRRGRGPEERRKHQHRKKLKNAHRSKSFYQQQRRKGATVGNDRKSDQQQAAKRRESSSSSNPMPVFSSWTPRRSSTAVVVEHHHHHFASSADERVQFLQQQQQQQHLSPSTPSIGISETNEKLSRLSRGGHHSSSSSTQQKRRDDDDALLGPLWPVPFSYAFGSAHSVRGQTVRQFWLLNETLRFVDVGLERSQYMLANPHWVYAFRVNYDVQNWRMLIAQLHKNHQELPTMSRMQLIVDGETFLRQSANPQLFVHLLSYLANEDDLGVLLVGLDALHALLELFSASDVFGPMLLHFVPVIRQFDRQLSLTAAPGTDPELAALWLLSPLRLAKLYQLRCAANLGTCAETKQVRRWLAHPTALAADNHQQVSALCQHLFAHAGPAEVSLLSGLLKQSDHQQQQQAGGGGGGSAFAALIHQLSSACVQDEALVRQAVADILRTRNAIVYSSALNNAYTVNYNRKFRELFWTGLTQQLNIHERQVLFAVNTGKSNRMARILLHSVRSLGELNLVKRVVLHQWPEALRVEMDYLRRKLSWTEREACEQIRKHLVLDATTRGAGGQKPNRRR